MVLQQVLIRSTTVLIAEERLERRILCYLNVTTTSYVPVRKADFVEKRKNVKTPTDAKSLSKLARFRKRVETVPNEAVNI